MKGGKCTHQLPVTRKNELPDSCSFVFTDVHLNGKQTKEQKPEGKTKNHFATFRHTADSRISSGSE